MAAKCVLCLCVVDANLTTWRDAGYTFPRNRAVRSIVISIAYYVADPCSPTVQRPRMLVPSTLHLCLPFLFVMFSIIAFVLYSIKDHLLLAFLYLPRFCLVSHPTNVLWSPYLGNLSSQLQYRKSLHCALFRPPHPHVVFNVISPSVRSVSLHGTFPHPLPAAYFPVLGPFLFRITCIHQSFGRGFGSGIWDWTQANSLRLSLSPVYTISGFLSAS